MSGIGKKVYEVVGLGQFRSNRLVPMDSFLRFCIPNGSPQSDIPLSEYFLHIQNEISVSLLYLQ
jgi:hypothetical protein